MIQEDQDNKMRLLNTINSAVDNFIKIKYMNKKSKCDSFKEVIVISLICKLNKQVKYI